MIWLLTTLNKNSSLAKKSELLMLKYSRDQSHRTESNFTGSSQSKGSFKQYSQPLKVKKSQIHKPNEMENTYTPFDFNSMSKIKSSINAHTLNTRTNEGSNESTSKRRKHYSKYNFQVPKLIKMNIRDNSDKRIENVPKTTTKKSTNSNTQLLNYTHKSKRLIGSGEKQQQKVNKSNSKSKRKLHNSTS